MFRRRLVLLLLLMLLLLLLMLLLRLLCGVLLPLGELLGLLRHVAALLVHLIHLFERLADLPPRHARILEIPRGVAILDVAAYDIAERPLGAAERVHRRARIALHLLQPLIEEQAADIEAGGLGERRRTMPHRLDVAKERRRLIALTEFSERDRLVERRFDRRIVRAPRFVKER